MRYITEFVSLKKDLLIVLAFEVTVALFSSALVIISRAVNSWAKRVVLPPKSSATTKIMRYLQLILVWLL